MVPAVPVPGTFCASSASAVKVPAAVLVAPGGGEVRPPICHPGFFVDGAWAACLPAPAPRLVDSFASVPVVALVGDPAHPFPRAGSPSSCGTGVRVPARPAAGDRCPSPNPGLVRHGIRRGSTPSVSHARGVERDRSGGAPQPPSGRPRWAPGCPYTPGSSIGDIPGALHPRQARAPRTARWTKSSSTGRRDEESVMPKYVVHLTTVASTSITVEAEDKAIAIEAAYEEELPSICAQCSGWGRPWSLDLGDQWEPAVNDGEDETAAVDEVDR